MPKENPNERLSRLIKTFKERALSMRQLGMLTNIDRNNLKNYEW